MAHTAKRSSTTCITDVATPILLPGATVAVVLLAVAGTTDSAPARWSAIGLAATLALTLALFAQLRVHVSPTELRVGFVAHRPSRTLLASQIVAIRPVSLSFWVGWGIRWLGLRHQVWRSRGSSGLEIECRDGSRLTIGLRDREHLEDRLTKHEAWRALLEAGATKTDPKGIQNR